jgi:SprA family protein
MIASSVSSVMSTPAVAKAMKTIATQSATRLASCGSCGSAACAGCGGAGKAKASTNTELSEGDRKQVDALKARDREVRAHERAHQAAGGSHAGAASYTFQKGPDGRAYAVGGEVPIDASEVKGDPQATIEKMQQVKAAALAPAEPSGQDRKVAALADARIAQARAELNRQGGFGTRDTEPATPGDRLQPSLNQQIAEMRQGERPAGTSADSATLPYTAPADLTAYAANAYRQQASPVRPSGA